MDFKKLKLILSYALLSGITFTSCTNEENIDTPENTSITEETRYANKFAKEVLELYYYWNEEISKDLNKLDPEKNSDPITTVEEIRYHDGTNPIDKWTMLTNNMDEFTSSVQGVSTTYGYTPIVYYITADSNDLIAVVAYVSKDSPAEKAGLKRGDIIYQIDGKTLTVDNYMDLYYSSNITLSFAKLNGLEVIPTDKKVSMTAIEMYENPILCDTVYNFNGKKVGYLAYSSFDLESIPELINICKDFKSEGIKELVLDLRYNGGGYVITENVLASMFAPQTNVTNKDIFEKEDYNDFFTEYYKQEGISTDTQFETEYNYNYNDINQHVSTKDANIGLEKIYGIITKNSASASEALLSGLMPYMDIELIGQQSHGKYCTGWMLAAEDAYKTVPPAIKNWGIYVMVSIYKNANDETPCMPNGLTPDIIAEDYPQEPYQLGDVNEAMLKVALQKAGKVYPESRSQEAYTPNMKTIETPKKANFGRRIIIPSQSRMPGIGLKTTQE